MGVDAELLELSWNNSKPTPCLLVRPTYQATSHHAAAAACVLNARAPLGVTHHTNERARETSTTAPPCPLPTHSTRGTGRAITNEPGFVSRVVVVVVSSVGVFGSSTEEPNGGRHRGGKLKYPALGVCFYVPSVICPGPIRLCPAQNDQKGVRATTGKLGIFLIWVFCRRPQFSCLITKPASRAALGSFVLRMSLEEPPRAALIEPSSSTIEARTPTLGRGTPKNGRLIYFGAGGA